jgi:hypothetical protein
VSSLEGPVGSLTSGLGTIAGREPGQAGTSRKRLLGMLLRGRERLRAPIDRSAAHAPHSPHWWNSLEITEYISYTDTLFRMRQVKYLLGRSARSWSLTALLASDDLVRSNLLGRLERVERVVRRTDRGDPANSLLGGAAASAYSRPLAVGSILAMNHSGIGEDQQWD